MQNFTLPAYVEERTGSAALVGLLVFTQLGPLLLLSIPAGVLADRFPRRPYLIVMQAIQGIFSAVLAVLVGFDSPLWTLLACSLIIGIGNALNAPAFQASVPLLVDRRDLAGAVSLNSVMINGSRVIGPLLAAVLSILGVSHAGLFLVNAVTYLFLIAAILVVHIPDVRGQFAEVGWRRLLTGINIARSRPVLARALLTMTIFSMVCLVYVGLFPSVAARNFGIDVDGAGYKLLYAVLGRRRLPRRARRRDRARPHRPAPPVRLRAVAVRRQPGGVRRSCARSAPAFPVAFVLGFAYFLTATALITIFQENLADTERASVMPLWFMAFGGSIPIGNLIFGPIIDAIGARWVLGIGAVVALWLAWWCDLRRMPADELPARARGGRRRQSPRR